MASLYNSTPFVPGADNYLYPLEQDNFYQFDNRKWEDVKSYNAVILTVSAETPGNVKLRWGQGHETEDGSEVFPGDTDFDNPLAYDEFYYPAEGVLTKQYDTRSRFLSVWFDGSLTGATDASLSLATVYKTVATEIKLTDEDVDIVAVHRGDDVSNSLYVGLTDLHGHMINSTLEGFDGEAIYTHLADSSGISLATTNTYRNLSRSDRTDFSFNNDVNSRDWTTVITETNEFMLPTSELPFKHGDIVKFIVLRDGETQSVDTIFDDSLSTDGYLKVRAKVYYTDHNDDYTKFRLMVNNNIGSWFDSDVPRIINLDQMTSSGFISYDASNNSYKLLTHNRFDDAVAVVDDYYNIIADVSGFNYPNGIEIGPGRTALDLRLYRGSFHTVSGTVANIVVEKRNDPKESVCVALRDSDNKDMTSTQGVDSYLFQHDYCHPQYPRVLIVLDDVSPYANPAGDRSVDTLFLQNVARTFTVSGADVSGNTNYYNLMLSQVDYVPEFNNSVSGPCYALIQSSNLNDSGSFTHGPMQLITDQDANAANMNFPTQEVNFNLWETAHDAVDLINTYSFTDLVFVTSSAYDFSAGDIFKDKLDGTSWQSTNRYIMVPGSVSGEDLLHFVGGQSDHIITYPDGLISDGVNHSGKFRDVFQPLINKIHLTKHSGHNALAVHPTDAHGNSQAGTTDVTAAPFGDTALYYSFADASAQILDSTTTATDGSNNAMYVHIAMRQPEKPACAESISSFNPIPVAFNGDDSDGKMFDLTVSGPLTTLPDISNGPINLHSINIVNETATPVWVRLYNVGSALAATLEEDFSVDLSNNVVFNLPVPALATRDIPLSRSVGIDKGLHFAASTNYRRDTLFYPPGKKHIFINGNYKPATS